MDHLIINPGGILHRPVEIYAHFWSKEMVDFNELMAHDDAPEMVVSLAAYALEQYGVKVPSSTWEPSTALMVAEAVNLAAKTIDDGFYAIKHRVIDAAVALGCAGGWGSDGDGVFYLHHPDVGVACFHDPFDEIKSKGRWFEPWSGIPRQNAAFQILGMPAVRRLYREATQRGGAVFGIKAGAVNRAMEKIMA